MSANLKELLLCFLQFIAFNHIIIFLPVPLTCTLFLYFPTLTGNGFACHITLVTGCVMDGILVRALFCLRHATGQRHPATHTYTHTTQPAPTLYLSHAATCSRHPELLRIFYHSFPAPMAPHCGSFICWYFSSLWPPCVSLLLCESFCVRGLHRKKKIISFNNAVSCL